MRRRFPRSCQYLRKKAVYFASYYFQMFHAYIENALIILEVIFYMMKIIFESSYLLLFFKIRHMYKYWSGKRYSRSVSNASSSSAIIRILVNVDSKVIKNISMMCDNVGFLFRDLFFCNYNIFNLVILGWVSLPTEPRND